MTYNVTGRGARPQDNLRPQKDIIVSEHRGGGDTNVRKEEKPLKNGHDNGIIFINLLANDYYNLYLNVIILILIQY